VTACIGEPISWLRLEQFAASAHGDPAVAAHVGACPACARCLAELEADVVALPPLHVPAPRRRWWRFGIPALTLAAAAAVVLVIGRRDPAPREDLARVKGVGEVILGVVRERDGAITEDARTFRPGDRWKLVVTCPLAAAAWIDVDVDGDRPLAPARIACGNRVVVPGAFRLTGDRANRVCARISAEPPPAAAAGVACVTISVED